MIAISKTISKVEGKCVDSKNTVATPPLYVSKYVTQRECVWVCVCEHFVGVDVKYTYTVLLALANPTSSQSSVTGTPGRLNIVTHSGSTLTICFVVYPSFVIDITGF